MAPPRSHAHAGFTTDTLVRAPRDWDGVGMALRDTFANPMSMPSEMRRCICALDAMPAPRTRR